MKHTSRIVEAVLCSALMAWSSANAQTTAPTTPASTAPSLQMQVVAVSIVAHESAQESSPAVAQLQRGSVLSVIEQRGDWYKVRLGSDNAAGWVLRAPGEYGAMTLDVFAAAGEGSFATDSTLEKGDNNSPIQAARPGTYRPLVVTLPPIDPMQVAPPQPNLPRESIPVPDRWRLMQTLGFKFPLLDPYNQNPLKGDLPVFSNLGPDFFFNLSVISDSLLEFRRLPTPVAGQVSIRTGGNDIYGRGQQSVFAHNLILSFGLIKGDTTFKPPDYELRFVPVLNFTRANVQEAGALRIDPSRGTSRNDNFIGVQELFADIHLRNVSDRYDFDSLRVGIQPFTADFRGFLFQDVPFGLRLFGNRNNNQYQYNVGWFRRLQKDSNSGLNSVSKSLRKDDTYFANLYRQDWPVLGFTSQVTVLHNRNNETDREYDTNGFQVRPAFVGDARPHSYQVTYVGYNGDGHFGKWNLSTSTYFAFGRDSHGQLAQQPQQIRAGFHATELSRDFNWIRLRANVLVASGDKDPYDNKATGFDAIFENPQFAGSDTSFFIRQAIPLIGGGGVALSGRNSILPSLRSSKDEGQSNFVNPGIALIGGGADFDISPQMRVFTNISAIRFMDTSSLGALRNEIAPSKSLGTDFSVGFHWRPFFSQNVVVNGSAAALKLGSGLKNLYGENQGTLYSVALNAVLSF